MHIIDLTYIEAGIHEELVAYVADQQYYYEQEGVHVAIRDGRAWDRERLRRTATIGLGRAVLSRLTVGTPWTVLCVNTDRPLFWLLARDAYASVEELKGRSIGIHPPHTMPGWFSRIVLRKFGLEPDHDIQPVIMTPGDYARHIRRLAKAPWMRRSWAAPWRPRSRPRRTVCGCWPSSGTTSGSPRWASPWTPPT